VSRMWRWGMLRMSSCCLLLLLFIHLQDTALAAPRVGSYPTLYPLP
jgi:hypothetical protein